jgi:hypothetical protein
MPGARRYLRLKSSHVSARHGEENLAVDQTLRIYSNPLKLILYFCASLGFVVAALLLLRDPTFRVNASKTAIAYVAVFFFGLGVIVFFVMLLRDGILRRPALQIDAHGWTYSPSLGFRSQRVSWQDIGGVAIYRQQVRSSRMYYLVLNAKHVEGLPPSRARAMTTSLYPTLSHAAMSVPLNTVFMRTTPQKVEQLLRDIHARFANEMHHFGVVVTDTIQEI